MAFLRGVCGMYWTSRSTSLVERGLAMVGDTRKGENEVRSRGEGGYSESDEEVELAVVVDEVDRLEEEDELERERD